MWYVMCVSVDCVTHCFSAVFHALNYSSCFSFYTYKHTELGRHDTKLVTIPLFWLLWRTKFILSNIPTSLFTIMLLPTNLSGESGHETIVLHYWRAAGDILEAIMSCDYGGVMNGLYGEKMLEGEEWLELEEWLEEENERNGNVGGGEYNDDDDDYNEYDDEPDSDEDY